MATTIGIGSAIKRKEDPRLITGSATYTDDIKWPGMAYAAFVRSPHAHARILSVDLAAARAHPGVVGVFTYADLRGAWQAPLPCGWAAFPNLKNPAHWPMAADRVRHVGEIVAMVVAEDAFAARDAASLVSVAYEPLPAVVDLEAALQPGAPKVHDDLADNVSFTFGAAPDGVDAALGAAEVRIQHRFLQQRILGAAIEPRAVVAEWRKHTRELTLWSATQIPHYLQLFGSVILGVPEHRLRVIAPEVGGGFGSKLQVYPEEILVMTLAMRLGRPVKWTAVRSESMVSDHQGRQGIFDLEVGARRDGVVTAMKVKWVSDMGAYNMFVGPFVPILGFLVAPGPYRNRTFAIDITGVFTNTVPVDAIRGAGRPEVTYYLERIMDMVAHECGLDPAEVRRRNLVQANEFPWTNAVGIVYDSGNYPGALEKALAAVGYQELRQEQARRRQSGGKLLGIGLCSYIEACGGAPSAATRGTAFGSALWESALVRVHHTGKVTVFTGSSAHGQGHETVWSQIVADRLGVAFEDVEVLHGDTSQGPVGTNTYGSRSLVVGGVALYNALEKIREKARLIASHKLECHPDDVEFSSGQLSVKGAQDRSVSFGDVAALANFGSHLIEGDKFEPGLEATAWFSPANFSYPGGTHVCVAEVDTDTGQVEIKRYVAVDDCGVVINPLIAEGQVHGGIAMGIAQALYEEFVYSKDGQPLNATFMEYAVPSAADLPALETQFAGVPSPSNPLGAKGIGEAGTIAATPAVVNAVVDALAHLGVTDMPMPLRPERVWRAIHGSGQ